jgi:DNA end-binding protein Ku
MVQFGLVTFPVEAFNAHAAETGHLPLHQLHAKCHSRIRYQKTCPVHGPVDNDEIVSAYEYSKGKYVEIEPGELDELRTHEERTLTIDAFVRVSEIDPIYFDGRMYYLSPDGAVAREPYTVFCEALRHQQRCGVGQVVFSGKQQLVLVRPYRDALHMVMLHYAAEIRDPSSIVSEPGKLSSADKKVKLAEQLIEKWGEPDFDFKKYHDTYTEKEKALIAAKAQGRELVVPETEEHPEIISLMDALKKSIGGVSEQNQERRRSGRHTHNGHAESVHAHGKSHRGRRRRAS